MPGLRVLRARRGTVTVARSGPRRGRNVSVIATIGEFVRPVRLIVFPVPFGTSPVPSARHGVSGHLQSWQRPHSTHTVPIDTPPLLRRRRRGGGRRGGNHACRSETANVGGMNLSRWRDDIAGLDGRDELDAV